MSICHPVEMPPSAAVVVTSRQDFPNKDGVGRSIDDISYADACVLYSSEHPGKVLVVGRVSVVHLATGIRIVNIGGHERIAGTVSRRHSIGTQTSAVACLNPVPIGA